ncbi:hypothetical protein F5X97DRAFT_318097 [Nemania serpens]|nr:hypothetical protein F5X97DRAFT_318097 [Nemania serpens]
MSHDSADADNADLEYADNHHEASYFLLPDQESLSAEDYTTSGNSENRAEKPPDACKKLRDQLQQRTEIEEESYGKAIRVFTFVTLFFLPVSFVTSFFGMNTTDIRDIEQDQSIRNSRSKT